MQSFKELVQQGHPPGPNNLLAPIGEYLEAHGPARRREIIEFLMDTWRGAGGQPLSGQDWGSVAEREAWEQRMKRALSKLKAAGKARESVVDGVRIYGVWEWVGPQSAVSREVGGDQPETSVGSGKYLVYGLYDKRSKDEASTKGEDRWPIKIGMTKGRSPYDRIQDGAFLPDRLVWGVAVWTDDADADEKLLQRVLDRRGQRYPGNGGREWFVTNPHEIAEIYGSIIGPIK